MSVENKTKPTGVPVADFLRSIPNDQKRADAQKLINLMEQISKQKAYMWGPSIIGFGNYRYRYASGHSGEAPAIGFSPRKSAISLYVTSTVEDVADLLEQLGPHKTGVGCIYLKNLANIHEPTLKKLIRHGLKEAAQIDAAFERSAKG